MDFDLFDLLGIAFDPPETNAKRVKKKIEQKLTELESLRGRETLLSNRDSTQAQIDFLKEIAMQILTSDGKKLIDSAFKPLADIKTSREMCELTAIVELLAMTGEHTVTGASIRHYKKESRLSTEHVKKVFSDAGFEIIDKDPLEAFPVFPTYADRIYQELATLRKSVDPNPNGVDTSVVVDLYAFAAYILNDTKHIDLYKAMETEALRDVFESAARKYSKRNDYLGKLCASLSIAATNYVFSSENKRAAYERHLRYHSEELTKLFAAMKKVPEATLLKAKFADPCIKIICNYFPEYDVALAIYNKEAGFQDNYYCPTDWAYTIKCSCCDSVSVYDSEADAIKLNACKHCRKPLFKICDHCGKVIPVFKDTCPHCGLTFKDITNRTITIAEEESSTKQAFGIDLGNANSAISFLNDKGIAEIIHNLDECSDLLASAVYFQSGAEPVVGDVAKRMKDIEPERVVEYVQRHIGKPDASIFEFDGIRHDAVTISSLILKRLVSIANDQGHDVKDVIITCPLFFNDNERAATKQAGILAGLNVIDIVSEPIAAVMGYSNLLKETVTLKDINRVLVYNLGGGSFDITLLNFGITDENTHIEVIKSKGNDRLGGIDWDARMFDYMCQKYAFENGTEVSAMDDELRATIRAQVEQAKKDISTLDKKSYTIKYDGDRTRIELNRQEFEELTQDLVQQTMDFVHQLLSDVNFTPDNVDVVLLVGGSTLMPMIKNAVEVLFPGKVRVEQPNLVIAKGAAIMAAMSQNERKKAFGMKSRSELDESSDLNLPSMFPHAISLPEPVRRSYGIGIILGDKYVIDNLITLNMAFPAERERVFCTETKNQKSVLLNIFENASEELYVTPNFDANGNPQFTDPEMRVKRIGEMRLQLPPNTPKGSPIRVVFRSNIDGLVVDVTVKNMETCEVATATVEISEIKENSDFSEIKKRFQGINSCEWV